jgi:hypothetical protein
MITDDPYFIVKRVPALHLCLSSDELRPPLTHVHVHNGMACATNANALVWIHLEDYFPKHICDWLEGRYIPAHAWKHIHDLSSARKPVVFEIQCEDNHLILRLADRFIGYRLPDPNEVGLFPKWIEVWNNAVNASQDIIPNIGWDQSLMTKAIKSSGITNELAFRFGENNHQPILFAGLTTDGVQTQGLVMPQMISSNQSKITQITVNYVKA